MLADLLWRDGEKQTREWSRSIELQRDLLYLHYTPCLLGFCVGSASTHVADRDAHEADI